jgi:hypothetical protein
MLTSSWLLAVRVVVDHLITTEQEAVLAVTGLLPVQAVAALQRKAS